MSFEPLSVAHAAPLHAALSTPLVYEHLGGEAPPTVDELAADFAHRIAGPPADRPDEQWLNYAIALERAGGKDYIGRLEASLYGGGWGEVAYLLGPRYWGLGYASEAMQWWHRALRAAGARELWAAVTPANVRSLKLLSRLGYEEVAVADARQLGSYDPGDRLFRLELA